SAERSAAVLLLVGDEELVGCVIRSAVGGGTLPADHQGGEIALLIGVDVEVAEPQQPALVESALQQRLFVGGELLVRIETFDVSTEWRTVQIANFQLWHDHRPLSVDS